MMSDDLTFGRVRLHIERAGTLPNDTNRSIKPGEHHGPSSSSQDIAPRDSDQGDWLIPPRELKR